ncbi:MAG: hypothetical protein Q3972_00590 [Corynebacterium sp.]|nr:hypothetical protein [Corynebacterium sp.]
MSLIIGDKVYAKYAAAACLATPGVIPKAINFARDYPHVNVARNAEDISVDALVAVAWPSPVATVALTARLTMAHWIDVMVGTQIAAASVTVDAVQADPAATVYPTEYADLLEMIPDPPATPVRIIPNTVPIPVSCPQIKHVLPRDF